MAALVRKQWASTEAPIFQVAFRHFPWSKGTAQPGGQRRPMFSAVCRQGGIDSRYTDSGNSSRRTR